eukprot:COSAG02_NODE_21371_length_791_cov_0.293353_2_plen_21_part_01
MVLLVVVGCKSLRGDWGSVLG